MMIYYYRRDRLPTSVFQGFPCGSAGKEYTCNVGDLGQIPGLGRSPEEGKGYPFQYSGLDYTVHGVTKSWTVVLKAIYSSAFSLFYSFLAQLEILVKITVRVTRKQDISRHRKNKVTKDPACILKFIKMQQTHLVIVKQNEFYSIKKRFKCLISWRTLRQE